MKRIICAILLAISIIGCGKQQFAVPPQSVDFAQTVTYNNKVDIVLMMDNSSSMSQYQTKFSDQVPAMLSSLDRLGMDYNIVVVTSDMRSGGSGGMFVGSPKILNKNTPNLVNLLKSRVQQGQAGSDLERGLQSIQDVLSPNYLQNEGVGFLRSDALLAVIALSNEDDYSSSSIASLEQFFDTLKPKFKGTTQAWLMNFIGVPSLTSSCSTVLGGEYKEPGLRWIELANYSGGTVQAICDTSLAYAVDNVRKRIVEVLTDYYLSRRPKVETIVVKKNGVVVPKSTTDGWDYIQDKNLIRFYGNSVPSADETITVDFSPADAT
jgi:hypothetical protein